MKITDILVTPLRRIQTTSGDVLHAMKNTDPGSSGFGEAYFSWIEGSSVKAWKRHTRMVMNVVVPVGQVRFVFFEENADGNLQFRIEEIGVNNYARITVPSGIWFGFQGLGNSSSLVLNVASIPHEHNEVERMTQTSINYAWQ